MAGRPSAAMEKAMRLIRSGISPYKAADLAGIERPTMYKSKLYKAWKAEKALNASSGTESLVSSLQEQKP